MTKTTENLDSVGRPVNGPDGAYSQSPAMIRAEFARLADMVDRGIYPEKVLKAYSPFLYAESGR